MHYAGQYICVVEGAIPTRDGGIYYTVNGRPSLQILEEATSQARATIAAAACVFDAGVVAATPSPTGAVDVSVAVPDLTNQISLPGRPSNGVNLVPKIVHLLIYLLQSQ